MEIWELCKLTDDFEVSSLGNVRGARSKVVRKVRKGKNGYLRINSQPKLPNGRYTSKTFYVHRMVASTFLPMIEGCNEVNHLDCNKENNAVENLEWCNHQHNMTHALLNGRLGNKAKSVQVLS